MTAPHLARIAHQPPGASLDAGGPRGLALATLPRCPAPALRLALAPLLALVLALAMAACDPAPSDPTDGPLATPSGVAGEHGGTIHADGGEATLEPKPMLPAFQTLEELAASKADFFDDLRNGDLGTYGITASPSTPVIPAAEWDAKQALLISWTGSLPGVFAEIVDHANPVADLVLLHDGATSKGGFQSQMSARGVSTAGITYMDTDLDSIWVRDFGPISLYHAASGTPGLVDPRYYHSRVNDDAVPHDYAALAGLSSFRMPVDFEGGNFMSDGRGTCFFSQGVLWYNSVSQTKIEQYFREYLGCYQTVILHPLDGEGTTHIDMFTKLVDEDTVLLGKYLSSQDAANKALMDQNAAIYDGVVLAGGGSLDVVRMQMPSNADGNFRTYINSQFINGVNMVPTYTNDKGYESAAMALWNEVMPTWSHVALDATELITWAGAIHCVLMEVQAGGSAPFQPAPASICNSYDCYPTTTTGPGGCANVGVQGSCKSGVARWCDGGEVLEADCDALGLGCSWDATEGHFGCTDGTCAPNCAGKACGGDGCGGTCGACPTGKICELGACVPSVVGCGDVTGVGCCTGQTLVYCSTADEVVEQDCGASCGWDASGNGGSGWYDCGASGADPAGEFPLSCGGSCEPSCAGLSCGDNGCGGSCGTCSV